MLDGDGIILLVATIVLFIAGAWFLAHAWSSGSGFSVLIGLTCLAFAAAVSYVNFSWRPDKDHQHNQAVADMRAQHISFITLSIAREDIEVLAGTCRPTFDMRKQDGVYRVEIDKTVVGKDGHKSTKFVPVDRAFVDGLARLPACA